MKSYAHQDFTLSLELNLEEARLLLALADFPAWDKQPKHIVAFLEDLASEIDTHNPSLFGDASARSAGYQPYVSVRNVETPARTELVNVVHFEGELSEALQKVIREDLNEAANRRAE